MEIYTTGGGDFLTLTLNAIAAFTSSDNYEFLLVIAIAAGLIMIIFQVMFSGSLMDAVKIYIVVAVLTSISFADKSTVTILDKTKGPLWFQTVDNVPTSVAYVGHFTSTIAEGVTRRMETLFSSPTNIAYSQSGMLFGATLMSKTARWRAVTSSVHENLVNFFDQCVIDAVSLRYIQPEVITNAGDLEAAINTNLPNSLAYYDVVTETTRLCSEGWPSVIAATEADVNNVLAVQAAALYQLPPDAADTNGPAAIARLQSSMSDFASFAQVASTSAVAQVKQSMLIAAMDDAATRGIAASTNAAALEHLQSARAEAQTRSSYQAIGSNALSWVPYLKIVFENLYYGAFPLALMLMMTPMALTVVRGYFGGFLWLASWEPLSAILHSVMLEASAVRYRAITTTSSNGALDDAVINWANHFGVYSVQQDVAAMAGYLMMSIPFVATAIFFGSSRMTGLATSMLGVSQGAATETGREMATGNLSYGNASVGNASLRNFAADNWSSNNMTRNNRSWDNTNANRHTTSFYLDAGRSSYFTPNGTLATQNADGTYGFEGASSMSNTATSISIGDSVVGALRTTASQHMQRGEDYRKSVTAGLNDVSSQTSSFAQSISSGEFFSQTNGFNENSDLRETATQSISTIDRFAEANNISRRTAIELAAFASASGGIGGGEFLFGKLEAGLRTSLSRQGVNEQNFSEVVESAKSMNVDSAFQTLQSQYHGLSKDQRDSLNTTNDYSTRTTIDQVRRADNARQTHESASQAYNTAADQTQSSFVNSGVNIGSAFSGFLMAEKGLNATQTSDILAARTPEATALNAQYREEFAQNYIGDLIEPKIEETFGQPLPSPIPPARPNGNTNPGHLPQRAFGPLADAKLAVETGILGAQIDAASGIGGVQSDVAGQRAVSEARHGEASGRSQARIASDWTGGKLVETNNGTFWENADGDLVPQGTVDANGYYQAPNVNYGFTGQTVRSQPVDPELMSDVSNMAASLGPDVGVLVTSGGQSDVGPGRTGSTRHDHGNAVDFAMTRNGRVVTPEQDPALYAKMIEGLSGEHQGIGHYEWGLHVGGGSAAFWGPDKTSASADTYFRNAYNRGRN